MNSETSPKAAVDSDAYAEAPVLRARLEVRPEDLDDLLDALWGLDPAVGAWQDMESGRAWLQAFAVDPAALAATAAAMERAAGAGAKCVVERLPREDWAESWKKFFRVVRVSPRVTVRPPWESAEPERPDGVVVCIEPGMSFGTGLHGTTQTCLRFIESILEETPDASLLDLGCGSGILSIAARMLGFRRVAGVDYDAAAVRVAAENARENGVSDIPYSLCDVTADAIPVSDVVVANILAPVLVAAAPRIARAVSRAPGAALVLSGILDSQYADVARAYAAQGFSEVRRLSAGEWTSGLFRRSGGEEIHDVAGVFPRVDGKGEDCRERHEHDDPVDDVHGKFGNVRRHRRSDIVRGTERTALTNSLSLANSL